MVHGEIRYDFYKILYKIYIFNIIKNTIKKFLNLNYNKCIILDFYEIRVQEFYVLQI